MLLQAIALALFALTANGLQPPQGVTNCRQLQALGLPCGNGGRRRLLSLTSSGAHDYTAPAGRGRRLQDMDTPAPASNCRRCGNLGPGRRVRRRLQGGEDAPPPSQMMQNSGNDESPPPGNNGNTQQTTENQAPGNTQQTAENLGSNQQQTSQNPPPKGNDAQAAPAPKPEEKKP